MNKKANFLYFSFFFFFLKKANYWVKAARDDSNYRLQYDLPNTWSQKYNLIYQSILSLNLFSTDVAKLESDYYISKMLDYGIPLDSRSHLTKSDWTSWISAFSGNKTQADLLSANYTNLRMNHRIVYRLAISMMFRMDMF